MNKKLIDWASVPIGTSIYFGVGQTNGGVFTGYSRLSESILLNTCARNIEARAITNTLIQSQAAIYNVRLASADHQPWLRFEEGVTVVPEWAEVTYDVVAISNRWSRDENETLVTTEHCDHLWQLTDNGYEVYRICAYKLGNAKGDIIKDGWTDNSDEATE